MSLRLLMRRLWGNALARASRCAPLVVGRPGRLLGGSRGEAGRPAGLAGSGGTGRTHGFTLLEMLALIVLIGIAAVAVAVSVTNGLASARVRSASYHLASALRYTRTQAIVHAKPEVLTFDVKSLSYLAPGRPPRKLPRHMRLSVTSAAEDQLQGGLARIRFFPDGSSTGGHVILRRGAREWRINVAWLTGVVSVHTRAASPDAQP